MTLPTFQLPHQWCEVSRCLTEPSEVILTSTIGHSERLVSSTLPNANGEGVSGRDVERFLVVLVFSAYLRFEYSSAMCPIGPV